MKTMIIAAAAALSLATGAAFAQGGPAGGSYAPPQYGAHAFSNQQDHAQVHFLGQGTVFGRIFGISNGGQASRSAAKGG
jgi:hypothetical protein